MNTNAVAPCARYISGSASVPIRSKKSAFAPLCPIARPAMPTNDRAVIDTTSRVSPGWILSNRWTVLTCVPTPDVDGCGLYTSTMLPETRYVKASDGVSIAFQVLGNASRDLVWVPGWVSHLEVAWEEPTLARFFERLASFSRLILFDKRGTGLSDRVPDDQLPTLETRMDDLRAVMDAVGSKRAALFGYSEGGNMCMLFAATHPERTVALVTYSCFAKRIWSPD